VISLPHTALYRKRRSRTFQEIVGQQHIVRALRNQLLTGQVSHAYLFCGTRGTGKTSVARIFARAVNCLDLQNGDPCNVCEMCLAILAERCMDVAEIDAASNNGVENIRDLREEVKYPPTQGQYKVYIVDEVHMLSTSAFNALLKTLEEPPSHVIFILATTDPQKIPATILSRCQRYDFRRIAAPDMTAALKGYLLEENISFEDDALDYIAYHSDGAMRDALSLLDQCLSMGGDGLTLEKVRDMLGAVDRARLFEFTDALYSGDSNIVMTIISQAMDDGRDVSQFAADLVRHFRDVLVAGLADGEEFSAQIATMLKEQSTRIPAAQLMAYIHAFSETLREMRFAPHMRTAFEVCALRMCMPTLTMPIVATPPTIAEKPQPKEEAKAPPPPPANTTTNPPQKTQSKSPTSSNITADWFKLCKALPNPLRSWCASCGAEMEDGVLKIISNNETTLTMIKGKQNTLREALADILGATTPPTLVFEVQEAYNNAERMGDAVKVAASTANTNSQPEFAPPEPDDWVPFDLTTAEDTMPSGSPEAGSPPDSSTDEWAVFGEAVSDDQDW